MADVLVYHDGELELNISVNEETIWLTQKQIAELFAVTVPNINMHIKVIYKEGELFENRTIQKYLIVQQEGKREVRREIDHYNLDVIISVGYRVNSIKATKFRQWATSVLKSYITDGYAINSEKITNQRFRDLENDVVELKAKIDNISNSLEDQTLKPKQHIFYDGQVFDAYLFVSDIIKSAKKSVKLIDNYVDESTLVLFTKRDANVSVKIYTKTISRQLQLDIQKHNAQYSPIEIEKFDLSHDRFMIIDEKIVYHFGASLKDLGKKWFAVSKMEIESFEMSGKLE
jgi:hypothetical protein